MTATFKLRPDELNEGFLASLREMFARKGEINILVSDAGMNETAFLMSDADDYERLLQSIEHIEKREGLVDFDLDTYK